ncbi:sugar phosphate isomerase/epimerase family protein [Streptomyces flavochromogenes]|uniref:sugar phosphate isomerase/epimerase family protein n=1 Tax=Streptomyces flavochromogenes TaxID=68199 RepID=UPI0004BF925D|nr:sugar phosphate isomerase/epimerase family protein [Streptomyces flavochromogenes]
MNLDRFSVNQMTVKQLSLPDLVAHCVRLGIPGVGLWREPVQEYGVEAAAELVRDAGLTVTTLCRGGFFTSDGWEEENRTAIDEAVTLGTDTVVLVSGGLTPAFPDLPSARARITEAIGALAPYAGERGIRLAVEPLHPMYAADRCAVSTLDQALAVAEHFPPEQVGVVVDTYHLWWDDRAPAAVERAGAAGRIHSFQLADWTTPLPAGVLTGRGQLGTGAIDLRAWADLTEKAGWTGPVEVEIFNDDLWSRNGVEVLEETLEAFLSV